MINMLAQQTATIEILKRDNEERKAREASQQKDEESMPILGGSRLLLTQGPGNTPSPQPYANGIPAQMTGVPPMATGMGMQGVAGGFRAF
jgi:clathrin heavy chain